MLMTIISVCIDHSLFDICCILNICMSILVLCFSKVCHVIFFRVGPFFTWAFWWFGPRARRWTLVRSPATLLSHHSYASSYFADMDFVYKILYMNVSGIGMHCYEFNNSIMYNVVISGFTWTMTSKCCLHVNTSIIMQLYYNVK